MECSFAINEQTISAFHSVFFSDFSTESVYIYNLLCGGVFFVLKKCRSICASQLFYSLCILEMKQPVG